MNQIQILGDKVSIGDVNRSIVKEKYIQMGKKKCVCHLTLKDGWEVIGVAGIVNPELYDPKIGEEVARAKALDKVWLHLGSLLQNRMAGE